MPSAYFATRFATYRAQRTASQGASITLVSGCGELTALFDCASRCATVLGSKGLTVMEINAKESVPKFHIPFEDAHSALTKLSAQHSVAILDTVCDASSSRYVLLWKINPSAKEAVASQPATPNLDEY